MLDIARDRPELYALLSYWRAACEGAPIPHLSKLSPLNLRRWVGDISVIHIHDGPKRFFVSLHGANVARHIGPDFHKKYLEDTIPSRSLTSALAPYEECIARRGPVFAVMTPTLENSLHSRLERMALPFCGQNLEKVDRILVWVAPNNRTIDASASIYDDSGARGGCEQSIALYSFDADDKPRSIDWPAISESGPAKAAMRGWRKVRALF